MPLSNDDFRQLKQAMEDLTRVAREQLQQGSEASRERGGPSRRTAAGGEGAEERPLLGFATSIARTFSQNTGPAGSAISSIIQGGQQGGALGAAAAAGSQIVQFAASQGAAQQHGVLSAPLFSGRGREQFEGNFREQSNSLDAERAVDAPFNALGFRGPAQLLRGALGFQTADPTQQQRQLDEDRARRSAPVEGTIHQLDGFFGSYAAPGGHVTDKQLQGAIAVTLKQQKARQDVHERISKLTNEMGGFVSDNRSERM